jgi:hypothetical protein
MKCTPTAFQVKTQIYFLTKDEGLNLSSGLRETDL